LSCNVLSNRNDDDYESMFNVIDYPKMIIMTNQYACLVISMIKTSTRWSDKIKQTIQEHGYITI
jgi:hypothetical protein